MSEAQTITSTPSTARRSPIGVVLDHPGRWFTGVAAVAGAVAGWWSGWALPYLLGMALLLGLAVAVWRSRPVVAGLAAVAVAAAGIALPWLAVRQAYQHEGSRLSSDIPRYSHSAMPVSDGGLHLLSDNEIIALGPDGKTRWHWQSDYDYFTVVHALPDGSLVVAGHGTPHGLPGVVLGLDGKPRWSFPPRSALDITAISDRTLVTDDCSKSGCRYVGRNVIDGSITWTVTADRGRAHSVIDLPGSRRSAAAAPSFSTDWFATTDASGAHQLRSADTGAVVRSYPEGHQVWRAGDAALIIGPGPSGCVLEIARTGRALPPPAAVDCALEKSLATTSANDGYGRRTGDAVWSETTEDGSAHAVDLNNGTARRVPPYWPRLAYPAYNMEDVSVLGAGVQVESTRDAMITRDATTGKVLWRLDLPATQVPTIVADGRLVVVLHKQRRLLLGDLLGPDGGRHPVLRAFDARSGELLYQARGGEDPVIIGDRMLAYLPDRDGSPWLFTPSG